MDHTRRHQYLEMALTLSPVNKAKLNVPPKLPFTANLALSSKMNEYNEIPAMQTKVMAEKSRPPLKKLTKWSDEGYRRATRCLRFAQEEDTGTNK